MASDEERKSDEMELAEKQLQNLNRDIQKMKTDDVQLLATLQSSSAKDVVVPWLQGMLHGMRGDAIGPATAESQPPRMRPWSITTEGMKQLLPPRLDDFSSMDPVSKRACIRRGLALPDEHLRALIHGGIAAQVPPGRESGAPRTTTMVRVADYDHGNGHDHDHDEDRSTCSV